MKKRTTEAVVVAGVVVAGLMVWMCERRARTEPAYVGKSEGLHRTVVMATADDAVPAGKNAIWCVSAIVAWEKMREANGGTLVVAGAEDVSRRLSDAGDASAIVPEGCLTVGAGRVGDQNLAGSLKEMRGDACRRLADDVMKAAPRSVAWWAYLSATVSFPEPYIQNDRPLVFGGANGVPVRSFGIGREYESRLTPQRRQIRVLFDGEMLKANATTQPAAVEYAVDLCQQSKSSQVVVARIARPVSLAEGVAYVQRRAAECERSEITKLHEFGAYDTLMIPDVVYEIDHRFAELEGKQVMTGIYQGFPLTMARQAIRFRLDRSGTSLESSTWLMAACEAREFVFDGPFLIYLCKRGESRPYFAMWVDNAELLSRW